MPIWVKGAVDRWLTSAAVTTGRVFRAVSRHGTSWGAGISENVVWYVVRKCSRNRKAAFDLCTVGGSIEGLNALTQWPNWSPLISTACRLDGILAGFS
jgi:hypothetical protein